MNDRAITRRAVLKGVTGAATALAAAVPWTVGRGAARPAAGARATLRLDEPGAVIAPGLYGQFVEHLGGVVYDGVWVGPDSKVPNVQGIRKDLIDHVKRLGPVVVRWPGGCFADRYHWRDGIGPRESRPRRFGRWREETESNAFGLHEFMTFCRLCGVEPYLAANVGTGTPEEFQQWVEYCNAPAGSTTLADERVANGSREPFRVRYWGVGNESWGCGGKFTPEDYCREYRKFTEWVPSYGVPLYLIAAGPNGNDTEWTRRFFTRWSDYARAPIQGWAPHYYCGTTGHALDFNTDQWYEMLHKADRMEALVRDQWKTLGEFDRKREIKLCVDEWGAWHPDGTGVNPRHQFEQMGSLRDALVAALTLDTFQRHADKIDMANVAQIINCIHSLFLADGDRFVATPNFHVFEMYRAHQQARALPLEVEAAAVGFRVAGRDESLFRVAGSASRGEGGRATVTLVHTHATEPIELALTLRGGSAKSVRRVELSHGTLNAHNTFERPDEVVPRTENLDTSGAELRVTLAPASVTRLDLQLG
jgi:alpha-N-arabinofuranosidase